MATALVPNVPKYDWYQTESAVVVTVLVKGLGEADLKVDFQDTHLSVTCPYEGNTVTLDMELWHQIVSDQSSYKITPSKVEIKLKKREGIRWDKLEGTALKSAAVPKQIPSSIATTAGPPTYPSAHGKDWNAIERDIKAQEAKEKPEGEEALQKMFQEIYGKGSDEIKKAMNKSYMESGGTVLSTNWNEIGKDKVEVKPPDGLEWKKWN